MGIWVIIVAAGSGSRFGGPKQFANLAGRPVIDWSLQVAASQSDGVVLVVAEEYVNSVTTKVTSGNMSDVNHLQNTDYSQDTNSENTVDITDTVVPLVSPQSPGEPTRHLAVGVSRALMLVVAGGATRSQSVRCGLKQVPKNAKVVLVHDGARPLADGNLYQRVIGAVLQGADVAVPAVDIVDSMRMRSGGAVDRSSLAAIQTPQAFRFDVLRTAHAADKDASDDATLAEMAGFPVVLVEGDHSNLKITRPEDLVVAEALIKASNCTADLL